ncbi:winged helix-turn-helix transcriptional regulator [Thauera sp.]|uniref:winged helix-turn-helix transcriptional regulator n=1 Tax=Thauera sp. TaxID=1905334 RepID=UPI0039E67E45
MPIACAAGCTVEATLDLIGGKWKGVILYRLLTEQVLRFNELRRLPPKVEYRLTDYGQTLAPVIHALKSWGDAHIQHQNGTDRSQASSA